MKKKLLISSAVVAAIFLSITALFLIKNRLSPKQTEARSPDRPADISLADDRGENVQVGGAFATKARREAPSERAGENKKYFGKDAKSDDGKVDLGRVFAPASTSAAGTDRRLEYNIAVAYQIDSIKSARAFFTQWIPRYGFLSSESASGHQNGYMTMRVRIRSANLYAALNDLDAIGALTSENITVIDHTENAVHQQMLAVREEIRNRRRVSANAGTTTASKNWEATENLVSQSEDKQLNTRMEEWRISDRTGWATLQITLSLPVVTTAPVEVPEFRNAFVGLLNVLLQFLYALIYLVPLLILGYGFYRIVLRTLPSLKRLVSGNNPNLT